MPKPLRILVLEDSDLDVELAAVTLSDGGITHEFVRVITRDAFTAALEDRCLDLILSDYSLPQFDGLTALRIARERRPELPFIFVSGALGEELAVDSLQSGATDYVLKQRLDRLVPAVRRAVELSRERSDRRLAEERLRQAEDRNRLLIQEVREFAILFLDRDGHITSANPGAEAILGYGERELVGQRTDLMFTPEDRQRGLPAQELRVAAMQGRATDERWQVRRDGSAFFASGVVTPLPGPDGLPTGYIKIFRDATERQRAEEERARLLEAEREARNEAEISSRAKDEFLATLSHELRTPLNAILGWSTMLRSGRLEAEELDQGLEIIERNAIAQSKLIDDILDVSRIISGKIRLEVRPVRVADIVHACVETFRLAAQAKAITLQTDLDESAFVLGDAGRLQQVVWNLLSNAIKFTHKVGTVSIKVRRRAGSAEIAVSDTGVGIKPDFIPHVFERFRQADIGPRRAYGGLGLGLAIVRHVVEMHGGTVSAFSDGLGHGATFQVTIPLAADQDDHAAAPASEPVHADASNRRSIAATELPPSLKGLTVLAVEDQPDARALIVTVLRECGARVNPAASVAEALDHFAVQRPDVLISDIAMPGQDGYNLMRRIRQIEADQGLPRTPAAALTAHAQAADRSRAEEAGFDMHIAKPIRPADLLAAVSRLIELIPNEKQA